MQGIKFNLDTNSVAKVKEDFNKLVQELENNAKIDIKVNNKIFQELNTQISQTNNQLQNLIIKNHDVGDSFTNISNKVKNGKLFDPNSFVEYTNALDKIKERYSILGQVNFNNKTFNPVTKELEGFVVNVQKADGIIQKLKYDLQTVNGNKGFVVTNLNQVDNTAKIREKQLQTEQKINRQIEEQNKKLNEQIFKAQDSLNVAQQQWQQKIKGLFAGDIVPKDKILKLESIIKNINLGTTKSDMQVIKNYYSDLVKLEQQLVAEKNKEKDATKSTMEAYVKEQDRIAKMGQFKAKLPTQNVFKDDQALKSYIKSLYDANAKITQFANSTKNAEQAQRTINVVAKNANNEIKREKLVIDEATQSIYKQSEAISNNTSKMNGLGSSFKSAFSGIKGYMSTMLGLYAIIGQIRHGLSFVNNIDKKLTDIAIITGRNKEELRGYAQQWNETAIKLGTVTDEILDANEKYLRAGKTIEQTNKFVETNIKLSRIANDTNADTAEYLIAISNAYELDAKGVDKYANKVAFLDSATATCASNINKSFVQVAQTAKEGNISMDYLLAMIGTIQERSKMAPEMVSRTLRSMLINIKQVKEAGKGAVSDLEVMLNKQGIALRKNQKEWRSSEDILKDIIKHWKHMDGVTQSMIKGKLAGKVGSEALGILVNQSERLEENLNNVAHATDTLNEKYKKHTESTQYKINQLISSSEKLWMSIFNSNTINKGVGILTKLVDGLNNLLQSTNTTKIALLGMATVTILMIKHLLGFVSVLQIAGKDVTIFQGIVYMLTGVETTCFTITEMLAGAFGVLKGALVALCTTPAGLAFLAITGAIGIATSAIIKHMKHQKQLKEDTDTLTQSYKNLNEAVKKGDYNSAKTEMESLKKKEKELQDLLKKRKELQDKVNKDTKNFNGYSVNPNLAKSTQELANVSNKIKDIQTVFKGANITFDETTGKIKSLSEAEELIANNEIANKIKETAQAELDNKKEVISLAQEYLSLNKIQHRNGEQNRRLSELAEILKGKISGLIVTRNEEGQVIIKNTDLLGTEIGVLNTEGATIETLTSAKLENAKQSAIIEVGKTKTTYAEVKKRIAFYQAEMKAMGSAQSSFNKKSESLRAKWRAGTISDTERDELNNMDRWGNAEGVRASTNIIDLQQYINKIDDIYKSGGGGSVPKVGGGTGGKYFGTDDDKKGKKKKSKKSKDSPIIYNGKELDNYEAKIKDINSRLEDYDKNISNITQKITNLKSIESKSNYADVIEIQNKKLTEQRKKLHELELDKQRSSRYKNEITKVIYGKFKWMKRYDLDKLTEEGWNNLYNSKFGKDINFGTGDGAKKKQEAFEKQAREFEQLRKNYESMSKTAEKLGQDRLKIEEEINSTIKERIETQKASYEQQLKLKQESINIAQLNLDIFNTYEKDGNNIDYIKKAQLTSDLITQQKSSLVTMVGIRNEINRQMSGLQKNSLEWNLLNGLLDEHNNKIDESYKTLESTKETLEEIRKSQLKDLSDMQDKIVEALKKRYEKELEESKKKKQQELLDTKNLTKEQLKLIKDRSKTALEIFEDEHNKKIELLNEELKSYEEIYNAKIREIDDKESEDKYQQELNKKQQDKSKLQSQHDELLMDSSLEAKAKRESLLEQIKKKDEEIKQFEHDRDITLRKQNLKDALDTQKKKIQAKIDAENKEYKEVKKKYDKEIKALERANKEKLEKEHLYAEARELLMKNNFDNLNDLLVKYGSDSEKIFGVMGKTIKEQICDKLKEAVDLMQNFNTISDKNKWQNAIGYKNQNLIGDTEKSKEITRFGNSNKGIYEWDNIYDSKEYKALQRKFLDAKMSGNDVAQNEARKGIEQLIGKYKKHKDGGLNVSTGFHWLDGTDTKPELILNAEQTQAMINIKDYLPNIAKFIQQPKINLPRLSLPSVDNLNKQPIELKIDNLINIEGNIDKTVMPQIKDVGNDVLLRMKQEMNKVGIYRRL